MTRATAFRAAVFTLTALFASSIPAAQNVLKIVSGDKQSVARTGTSVRGGVADFAPLAVQLTDSSGKPLPGVKVTFTCNSPPTVACQLSNTSVGTATTDAGGTATLKDWTGKSAQAYYDTGKLSVTAAADNANQVAFELNVIDPPPAPVIAGAKMTVVSGDHQSVVRGGAPGAIAMAGFAPLQVSYKDGSGKPLAGAQVTWRCVLFPPQMACQLEPSGASVTTTVTDSNGLATLNKLDGVSVLAYYADGPIQVMATTTSAAASFLLAAVPKPATAADANTWNVPLSGAKIISGDKQAVLRTGNDISGGRAIFEPLTVQILNYASHPQPGVQVTFTCPLPVKGQLPSLMACQVTPGGDTSVTVTTDANGFATLQLLGGKSAWGYYASGKMPITAKGPSSNTVTFDLTVLDTPPLPPAVPGAKIAAVSGNGQKAARATLVNGVPMAAFAPLQVSVKDAGGKPLAGVQVTWVCIAVVPAMRCQVESSGVPPTVTTTDANGIATLSKLSSGTKSAYGYYADGPLQVMAGYGGAGALFTLSVSP